MTVKQMQLVDADLILYHRVASSITHALRLPLPLPVWADTGAFAFQRARLGSAQFIALSAAWLACADAEKAELMHSALLWTYFADQQGHKAPPASRCTPTTRREVWGEALPEYLVEMYALMPVCDHCKRLIHTNKPHKSCEAYASKMESRIAVLEAQILATRELMAKLEAQEAAGDIK